MPNVNTEAFWLAGWGSQSDSGTSTLNFTASGAESLVDAGASTLSFSAVGAEVAVEEASDAFTLTASGGEAIADQGSTTIIFGPEQLVVYDEGADTLTLTATGTGDVVTPEPQRVVVTPSGPPDVRTETIYVPARPREPRRVVTRQYVRVPAKRSPIIVSDPAADRANARRREEDELLIVGLL